MLRWLSCTNKLATAHFSYHPNEQFEFLRQDRRRNRKRNKEKARKRDDDDDFENNLGSRAIKRGDEKQPKIKAVIDSQ